MPKLTPVTKCPKCGHTGIEFTAFAEANLDDLLTCPACGHRAVKTEFTADLVNESAKLLQDEFRDLPGFTPK